MIINSLNTDPAFKWVPGKMKEIQERCKNDQVRLDKELAIFVADEILHTIKPLDKQPPPEVVVKYRGLSSDLKFKFNKDNPEWRKAPKVKNWLDQTSLADSENKSHIHWLKYWMSLDIGAERKEKLKNKLREFVGLDREETKKVRELEDTFKGRVVGSTFARPKDILYHD